MYQAATERLKPKADKQKMPSGDKKILRAIAEFLFLAVLISAIPMLVAIDSKISGHGVIEFSFTEITQATLILGCTISFGSLALKHENSRGCMVLIAGFFGCMFIRELDSLLDRIVHGFWVYPATILAATSIIYSTRLPGTVRRPALNAIGSKAYTYITIGLLVLLFFSRVFGTGQLWSAVMVENYSTDYRQVIQEGIELLGYILIAYGSAVFYHEKHAPAVLPT